MLQPMQAVVTILGTILTDDEQGCNIQREPDKFIKHAANRHASQFGGRFYLG